jgi:hypothetical protein
MAAATEAANTPPPPDVVLNLLNGFRASKVLFTLVKLGIPDLIGQQQQQPVPLPALASALAGASPNECAEPSHDGLGRLLDASVSLGLLCGDQQQGYGLTDVTKAYLLSVRTPTWCLALHTLKGCMP